MAAGGHVTLAGLAPPAPADATSLSALAQLIHDLKMVTRWRA
jgi:hypothetical protein